MAQFNAVAGRVVPITKGVALTHGRCYSICVGTAGTLNFTDAAGNTITDYPAQEGYNPLAIESVQAGGTADDLWALYEIY